jgi:hypothetical protein
LAVTLIGVLNGYGTPLLAGKYKDGITVVGEAMQALPAVVDETILIVIAALAERRMSVI